MDSALIESIDNYLTSIPYRGPAPRLYEPVAYTLESGGKRLRPLLCLRAAEAFGLDPRLAINQAAAIEMFHNFTLIHDDVMDRSELRRSRPTVYAKWGTTQAILSGDALLTLATQTLTRQAGDRLGAVLDLFNTTALEVYEGQQLDVEFETRDDVTTDEYLKMIRLKTSVLLGCACRMGAIMAGAAPDDASRIYEFGERLGLAFQLRDDWLDTYGDTEDFGKPIGGDIRNRKKTWLFITACLEAPHAMSEALNAGDEAIVDRVRSVYDTLSLSERCQALTARFCKEAAAKLAEIKMDAESRKWFNSLIDKSLSRIK